MDRNSREHQLMRKETLAQLYSGESLTRKDGLKELIGMYVVSIN